METKIELMKKIEEEVREKCTKEDIEYLLVLGAEGAGKMLSYNAVKDVVLKEIIALAIKLVPNK